MADLVRVEVNERGTPLLVWPDGDDHGRGESRREATVAEAKFWREVERLRERLEAAEALARHQATEIDQLTAELTARGPISTGEEK